jgi:hypothetical protein
MGLLDRLREGLQMIHPRRRDPAVVHQTAEAAVDVRTNGRLLREIRGLQGELERSRPSKQHLQGDAAWGSKNSSSA